MSIAELGMLVNSNFNKPLNEQARELAYAGSYLFTANASFSPDKTGWYKIIVVGAAGKSRYLTSSELDIGASGGVVIATRKLNSSDSYSITAGAYSASTGGGASSFTYGTDDVMTAGKGGDYGKGTGGTASGGDFCYAGKNGYSSGSSVFTGNDVGVFIPGLSIQNIGVITSTDEGTVMVYSGYGILGFGASPGVSSQPTGTGPSKATGCVLIIPLELEE